MALDRHAVLRLVVGPIGASSWTEVLVWPDDGRKGGKEKRQTQSHTIHGWSELTRQLGDTERQMEHSATPTRDNDWEGPHASQGHEAT